MTIQVGDTLPSGTLQSFRDGPVAIGTDELFAGKKVVLFAVPGAFTPTCSARHLPGYVEHFGDFKAKGVDTVACISVNDAFVMGAWGKSNEVPADLVLLADGNAVYTKALGLELDATGFGMGIRSQRYALVAEDGKVTALFVEQPGEFRVSSAESVLAAL